MKDIVIGAITNYNFEQVKNKHEGKVAFVCGLGPSFSENIDYVNTKRNDIIEKEVKKIVSTLKPFGACNIQLNQV
jgi:hypothetical protein